MTEIVEYGKTYQEYKAELDGELQRAAEGFVRIGYLLKMARDTDILKESGYANVVEFAQAEYNIDKTQVSRFIRINDKFSENGNSDHLLEKYKGFGYSKLTLMLSIPDEINEELSPEFSKSEIKAIKEEVDAEKQVTDMERLMEAPEILNEAEETLLEKVVHQLLHDFINVYESLWEAAEEEQYQMILCPDEEKIYSVRIAGYGREMLILNAAVTLVNIRTGEKECKNWEDLMAAVGRVFRDRTGTKEQFWKQIFEEEYPEVAPVQPKETPKKEPKVIKAVPEKKPEKKPKLEETQKILEEKEEIKDGSSVGDNIPDGSSDGVPDGCDNNITTDNSRKVEESTPVLEEAAPVEEVEADPKEADYKNTIRGYKAGISAAMRRLQDMVDREQWEKAKNACEDILFRVEQIMKLSGGNQ
ncbi:MAG: hypothetical protein J6K26_10570 [Lachnospiraceae bacterium]|nr:hypothetical protein [Lachnospiraceae bacterium]